MLTRRVQIRRCLPGEVDPNSREWLSALRGEGSIRDDAVARLHALLVRAAHYEAARRRSTLPHASAAATSTTSHSQAADDALTSVLARLDDFRGLSRFTTWAYKFALLETAVKLRRRAWQGREIPIEGAAWDILATTRLGPDQEAEQRELLSDIGRAMTESLTPHQRRVLIALAVNGVPIDVLAERLSTTRGALYKTLHDARRKLRQELARMGHALDGHETKGAR